jgi:hypothetical protein
MLRAILNRAAAGAERMPSAARSQKPPMVIAEVAKP